jgi:rhodanese-related sulfurtransferase
MPYEYDGVIQLETEEVMEIYQTKPANVILLDVREPHEYNAGHIPGIKLLPTSQFIERYEQELDKDKEYVVVCRSGNRSHMVCKFLQEMGYKKCANYAQGMLDWPGPFETANLPPTGGERW